MSKTTKLDKTLNNFIGATDKVKVAVIVPLYGYWGDSETQQFNVDTLTIALDRVYSLSHQVYILFVADEKRLQKEVGNVIMKHIKAGNSRAISVDEGASYADYVRAGIACAMDETNSDYLVMINPWIVLQHNSIDMIVDRVNREDIKIACGYDIKGLIDSEGFDTYSAQVPAEERNIDLDFIAMKRSTVSTINIDTNYKTCQFLERDMWQEMFVKGYEAIVSQRIPIFSFDVDWKALVDIADFESDKAYFISKWKYNPDLKYE